MLNEVLVFILGFYSTIRGEEMIGSSVPVLFTNSIVALDTVIFILSRLSLNKINCDFLSLRSFQKQLQQVMLIWLP